MKQAFPITGVILGVILAGVPTRDVLADTEPNPIAVVADKVASAVVKVVVVRPPRPEDKKLANKVDIAATSDQSIIAFGSGFIIDPAGFIATNRHVVDVATSVFAVTADGVRYRATIVGMPSELVDMALLHIDAGRTLPFIPFGNSDKMRVGDTVIAIGSPFGFDNTVTSGVISAVHRDVMESPFDEYLQTDASTNHGNSGGPLLNLAGEVIGMNSIIFAPGPGWVGLTFAIPSNDLRFVFDRLMRTGVVRAGMLPFKTQQVTWMLQQALDLPRPTGALVYAVDGGVEEDTINTGDVILSFNRQPVTDSRDLARKAVQAPIGSDAELEIFRGGVRQTTHITIRAWPESRPDPTQNQVPHKLGLELTSERRESGIPMVTVTEVDPAGTAADSGLQKGDIIVEVQQSKIFEVDQALRLFRAQSASKHSFAAVLVERGKTRSWISVRVPEWLAGADQDGGPSGQVRGVSLWQDSSHMKDAERGQAGPHPAD